MRDHCDQRGTVVVGFLLDQAFDRQVGIAHCGGNFREYTDAVDNHHPQIGLADPVRRSRTRQFFEFGTWHRECRAGFLAGNIDEVGNHGRGRRFVTGSRTLK